MLVLPALLLAAILTPVTVSIPAPMPAGTTAAAPFTVDGRGYRSLAAALAAVGDRTATVGIAPGVYRQCAVQTAGVVTYRAVRPGSVVFEGQACEGKAGLVLRGRGSMVDGIVFRGYRVGDGNGAGIRSERGDLTVVNAMFLDSQEGIGGGFPGRQRITIDHTTFSGLGQCDQSANCAHAVYLITPGSVSVTNSRFERGRGGHYVKIRAREVHVDNNSFDDSAGRGTNYMIDLANGGTGTVTGNSFVQGANKENGSTLIAVAAEARQYPTAGLRIDGNVATLAPGAARTAFVSDWAHQPLAIGANRLTGMTPLVRR